MVQRDVWLSRRLLNGSKRVIHQCSLLAAGLNTEMHISEKNIEYLNDWRPGEIFCELANKVSENVSASEQPIRFAVTASDTSSIQCEIGVIENSSSVGLMPAPLFEYRQRKFERTDKFNAVLIVPTGVGAEIGGHAGDATAVSRMMAEIVDTLVLHPNIVNASDINEMAEGCLICGRKHSFKAIARHNQFTVGSIEQSTRCAGQSP